MSLTVGPEDPAARRLAWWRSVLSFRNPTAPWWPPPPPRQAARLVQRPRHGVAPYRAAEGKRTYAAVARDLGISRETLRTWDATTPPSRRPRVVTDAAAVLTP
ncbi:hypothetical protein AB0D12_38040 [Streptomyces sp. NPDC048479]|uniref:hypothetical protein n=1 Tax=Streptomyces sp. NPDC048479 TaxID=3154725 RepID=UPI0034182ADA